MREWKRHAGVVMLGQRRVTRVPNRRRGAMYYLQCLCHPRATAIIAIEPSNDDVPAREMRLAERLARESEQGT